MLQRQASYIDLEPYFKSTYFINFKKFTTMKKFFQKLLAKLLKKVITKSVSDEMPEVPEVEPVTVPGDNSKKAIWRFIIQTLINILAAVLTAFGASSCVQAMI